MQSFILGVLFAICATTLFAQDRFALVIGNSDYQSAGRLANPANDAADVAQALDEIGFDVTTAFDADLGTLTQLMIQFRRKSRDARQSVIYFAGHGIAPTGISYVLPVDADLRSPDDLEVEAISVDTLTAHVAQASEFGLVILDACRDSPFMAEMVTKFPDRAVVRGLARATPRGGTLIAYATEANATAADGAGRNSPFTSALLDLIREPGLEISFLFRKVRDRVMQTTGGRQRPDQYNALSGNQFFLVPPESGQTAQTFDSSADKHAIDLALWQGALSGGTIPDFEHYASRCVTCDYTSLAERRIETLKQRPSSLGNRTNSIGDWFVILGSYKRWELDKANERVQLLYREGVATEIIDSNLYPNLTKDLFVVVIGPMSKPDAEREKNALRKFVSDAFIKTGR